MSNNGTKYAALEAEAHWTRRKVLEMAVKAKSGHISTAFSQMEMLVAIYHGGILRHDPANPKWLERDRFLLSKGQGGLGFYPILARRGYFPEYDLENFCGPGSHLGVHCEPNAIGVEVISGSLGHGMCIGSGKALALRQDGNDSLVYVMSGDGELAEGSCWESFLFASHHKLSNFVLIIDRNQQNTLGFTDGDKPRDGVSLEPLADKMRAFGFEVDEIDGHSFDSIFNYFGDGSRIRKRAITPDWPLCVISHTQKGRGLSLMQNERTWHYRVPSGEDLDKCWDELGGPPDGMVAAAADAGG